MRFLHTADTHLGAVPDRGFPWSEERADALWSTFEKMIQVTQEQKIDLLLIAGDLFHQQPRMDDCKRLDALFATIPGTKIVIIAGNHDYIRDTSPYIHYPWNFNVHILTSRKMTSVFLEDLNVEVHGFSYHSSKIEKPLYDNIHAPQDGRYHILLAHGGDENHIPINLKKLTKSGFDYMALGHNHQPQLSSTCPMAYSGSPEPTDRNDMGMRGYILGDLDEKGCRFRWYPCCTSQYVSMSLSVHPETTTEQIMETLKKDLAKEASSIHRLILNGYRNPEITFDKELLMSCGRIVDILDRTVPDYDLPELMRDHDHDLISLYIREMNQPADSKRENILRHKALFYGIRALLHSRNRFPS